MAFNPGQAPKVGGYHKGGSDTFGDWRQTGYRFDYGSQRQLQGEFEKQRLADAASGQTSVAQQQLRQGLGQAQRAMAAQAGAQGSNPLAQRAAIYGGAQMQGQANAQSAALRAQEMAAAQDAYSRFQGDLAQGHMGYDQMGLQRSMAQEQMMMGWHDQRLAQEEKERGLAMQMVGTAASAMAGAASDERAKMGPQLATGGQQDATIQALGSYGSGGGGMQDGLAAVERQRMSYQPPKREDEGGGMDLAALASLASAASDERAKMAAYDAGSADAQRRLLQLASRDVGALDAGTASMLRHHDAGSADAQRRAAAVRRLSAQLDREGADFESGLRRAGGLDPRDATTRGLEMYRYRYRPEVVAGGEPPGNQAGPMAQDLERTPLGGGVVFTDPTGMKRVDTTRGTLMNMGLIGRLGERQDAADRQQAELRRKVAELSAALDAAGSDTSARLSGDKR